jgi:hypothetical protein
VWQIFSFVNLNSFVSARGYTFFVALLCALHGLPHVDICLKG